MVSATILHISDIHRTPDEPVSNAEVFRFLVADLERHSEEDIPAPDIVVVSGDLTQSAESQQYDEAADFLAKLATTLQLKRERIVLVPGNHDVHWGTCEEHLRIRANPKAGAEERLSFTADGRKFTYESEEAFQQRLHNFREFYQAFKGTSYPESRTESFTIEPFDDLGIVVVGLSSVDLIDSMRMRATFNAEAVNAAITATRDAELLPIAVWHHDLDWQRGAADCLDHDSLRLLSTGSFQLGLCGHTHRQSSQNVHKIEGYALPVVAAGSLCAGPVQRPESMGRSYNVVQLTDSSAKVWVRRKQQLGTPWRDDASFGDPTERRSWFTVKYPKLANENGDEPDLIQRVTGRREGEVRGPNPFTSVNAKQSDLERVISDYVPTSVTELAQTDSPQILLGARGSGKTALLLTLTMESQLRSLRPGSRIERVGLFCQMKVDMVSAFNGKGALDRGDRHDLFRALIATMWATELLNGLRLYNKWSDREGAASVSPDVIASIAHLWGITGTNMTLGVLRTSVSDWRSEILRCLGLNDPREFKAKLGSLRERALLNNGLTALRDAAEELADFEAFATTRWSVLFDEVEFLNEWQQAVVYDYMANPPPKTSCKVATLPYAHSRAIGKFTSVLVLGEDYSEVPIELRGDRDFENVAKGLWGARLGKDAPALEIVWPKEDYQLVVHRHMADADLDEMLIRDLSAARQKTARRLLTTDLKEFGNQFRRKYQQPFRFRLAKKAETGSIPLYWGWQQMLKACGSNPRQFLLLADTCWNRFWKAEGLRPLSAEEQYEALSSWAHAFTRRCAALPTAGHELDEVVQKIASRLSNKLYNPRNLSDERMSVTVEDCAQEQAEAIAIGIAYGFLVPRLTEDTAGNPMFPTSRITMRLGYPVAVANELPLRQGDVLRIDSLRQLELPWWNE